MFSGKAERKTKARANSWPVLMLVFLLYVCTSSLLFWEVGTSSLIFFFFFGG